jgi:hypothetical protein
VAGWINEVHGVVSSFMYSGRGISAPRRLSGDFKMQCTQWNAIESSEPKSQQQQLEDMEREVRGGSKKEKVKTRIERASV